MVAPEWADYNGHMSESAYLLVFGDSADAFFRYFGVDEDYRASGRSLYTAETHLRHLREARVGERLRLTLQVLGIDAKRLHIAHEMHGDGGRGPVLATAEQMLLHVGTTRPGRGSRRSPAEIAARLRADRRRARGAAGARLRRRIDHGDPRPVSAGGPRRSPRSSG